MRRHQLRKLFMIFILHHLCCGRVHICNTPDSDPCLTEINCIEGEPCVVRCAASFACRGKTVHCPSNHRCEIHCVNPTRDANAQKQCEGMTINANTSSYLLVNVSVFDHPDPNTMDNSVIRCPIAHTCRINCDGDDLLRGTQIYAVQGFNSVEMTATHYEKNWCYRKGKMFCKPDFSSNCFITTDANLPFRCSRISTDFTCDGYTLSPTAFTATPTGVPSITPSLDPTTTPSIVPTSTPSTHPTAVITVSPTSDPTINPSSASTSAPTITPTSNPTATPSLTPTSTPSTNPSASPTTTDTVTPTAAPSTDTTTTPSSLSPTVTETMVTTEAPSVTVTNMTVLPESTVSATTQSPSIAPTLNSVFITTLSSTQSTLTKTEHTVREEAGYKKVDRSPTESWVAVAIIGTACCCFFIYSMYLVKRSKDEENASNLQEKCGGKNQENMNHYHSTEDHYDGHDDGEYRTLHVPIFGAKERSQKKTIMKRMNTTDKLYAQHIIKQQENVEMKEMEEYRNKKQKESKVDQKFKENLSNFTTQQDHDEAEILRSMANDYLLSDDDVATEPESENFIKISKKPNKSLLEISVEIIRSKSRSISQSRSRRRHKFVMLQSNSDHELSKNKNDST